MIRIFKGMGITTEPVAGTWVSREVLGNTFTLKNIKLFTKILLLFCFAEKV